MQTKTCSNCKAEKTISEFEASRWYKDGFRGQCRPCRAEKQKQYAKEPKTARRRGAGRPAAKLAGPDYDKRFVRNIRLKNKFGITVEQFDQMSLAQDHKCAICSYPASKMFHKVLYVDHCHKTGIVRGLLCTWCNTMLGRMGDDVAGVARVLEYVSRGA